MSTATIISQHTHPSFIWRIGPQRLRRGNSLYLLCWSVYLLTSSHPPASLTACPRMKSRGPIGGVTCRNSNYSIRAKPGGHTMPDVLGSLSIIGGGIGGAGGGQSSPPPPKILGGTLSPLLKIAMILQHYLTELHV